MHLSAIGPPPVIQAAVGIEPVVVDLPVGLGTQERPVAMTLSSYTKLLNLLTTQESLNLFSASNISEEVAAPLLVQLLQLLRQRQETRDMGSPPSGTVAAKD